MNSALSQSALTVKPFFIGSPKDLSDAELVRAFQAQGGHVHFMVLYERYAQRVYQRCLSYSRDLNEAEDLTRDVFLKLYNGLRGFRFDATFSTWLYRVTTNRCLNYLRDKKVFDELDEGAASQTGRNEFKREADFDMANALEQLPRGTKALLILKYVEGYTYEEIAELTEMRVSAVKMRISRAKESLGRLGVGHGRVRRKD